MKVKCKSCGFECYDIDIEEYVTKEIEHNQFEVSVNMICPNCKDEDNYEFLKDRF